MPECMTPFTLSDLKKVRDTINITVPCGKCPACMTRRASAWSFRLMQHEKVAKSSYFITITYDNQHVPITDKHYLSVSKRDLQLFFKRLRKRNTETLKYFAVAEYGTKTHRPHYHVILFNAAQKTIDPSWQLGEVHYGEVSGASIGYTLKYISKTGPSIPAHKNDDRIPAFALMSKGIGKSYITDNMIKWHNASPERMYVTTDQQQKVSMPRYYKNLIYSDYKRKGNGYIARQQMLLRKKDEQTEREKAESVKAAFAKTKIDANKNRFL